MHKTLDEPIVTFKQSTSKCQKLIGHNEKKCKNIHEEKFAKFIDFHNRIKTLVLEAENIFGTILGMQGLLGVFTLCTSLFSLTL